MGGIRVNSVIQIDDTDLRPGNKQREQYSGNQRQNPPDSQVGNGLPAYGIYWFFIGHVYSFEIKVLYGNPIAGRFIIPG
jgi:hypothetical protein